VPTALAASPFNVARTAQVPAGWALAVYARVPGARFLALTPEGNLLVSQPGAGKISLVRPSTGGGVPTVSDFATGLNQPHDMVFHTIGSTTYLYVAESDKIGRYTYQPGNLTGQSRQVLITGLPSASTPELNGAYAHALKNIALDSSHKLYVSIASTCNVCLSDTQSDPKRAAIYRYDADGTNRQLFAQGLRNAEGLAFIPGTDVLWVTVNGRDNMPYPTQDNTGQYGQVSTSYVDNHPPDSFTKVVDGGNYGWPLANPNPDGPTGLDNMPFDLDYDTNRTGAVPLSTFTTISKGIQAHSAALGFSFLQGTAFPAAYASGAAVALHGSWNRSVVTGYKVIYYPWNAATQTPGAQADLVTGFTNGGIWGRPVDVAVDPQGALLISDDYSGTIYKLTAPASLLATRTGAGASLAHLYPNPAGSSTATLDLAAVPAGSYLATVLDVLGRPVLPPAHVSGGGTATLALGSLGVGTYLVRLQGERFSQVLQLVRE
ncbi:MAG: sugar dehydrogenase, partial [Hymenobacter sp.]